MSSSSTITRSPNLRVSRRGFLKASGVGAAAAASGIGAIPFAASKAAAQQGWDGEHDVVVIGSGGAAFAAAITAQGLGSDVIMLEKGAYVGGTTLVSGGVMWIPNNGPMQEAGMADDRDSALHYMARYSFPHLFNANDDKLGLSDYDYDMLSTYYDIGWEAMAFIQETGAATWGFAPLGGIHREDLQFDYQSDLTENEAPQGRSINALDTDGNPGGGGHLIRQYQEHAERVGIPLLLNHRAERLVLNDDGQVVGVEVTVSEAGADAATPAAGVTLALRARKGVIFGSGGFARNETMMRDLVSAPYYGGCSAPTNEGDLLRMSSAVGARLGNLQHVWRNQGIFEQAVASSGAYNCTWVYPFDAFIMVNREGRRFGNEKRNYQDRPMAQLDWDPNYADWKSRLGFLVYSGRVARNWAGNFPIPEDSATAPYVVSGETLDDLAAAIAERVESLADVIGGFALEEDFAANLADEVAKFNGFAETGVDEDFGRGSFTYDHGITFAPGVAEPDIEFPSEGQANVTMYPLDAEGPYYAIIINPSAVDTNGGPVTNAQGQILTWDDTPVAGLYGAGNCVASPGVNAYWGPGATLGNAHVFGYAAGKHAHESSEKTV